MRWFDVGLLFITLYSINIEHNTLTNGFIRPGDKVTCSTVQDKPRLCVCKSSSSGKIIDLSSLQDPTNADKPR